MKIPDLTVIQRFILTKTPVKTLLDLTKRRSLPGFSKIPIYDVFFFFFQEIKRHTIITRANAAAFSFFLSLFPAMIVLFSLLSYLPFTEFQTTFFNSLEGIVPEEVRNYLLNDIIKPILKENHSGSLSISFLLALFFSSNGMINLMHGLEKSYAVSFRKRAGLRKRFVAINLTALLGLLLVASIVLIILGKILIPIATEWLHMSDFAALLVKILRWVVLIALFYGVISFIYRYGPATHERFGFVTPGTSMATLFSLLFSLLFSYFINRFGMVNNFYGPLVALIMLMLWIQINCFILIVGYELNVAIRVNRDLKEVITEE